MKTLKLLALVIVLLLLTAVPAMAVDSTSYSFAGSGLGAGLGAAFTIIGAGYGFGRISSAALESMARQPEVAGRIGINMIILAAMFEGVSLFALVICYLVSQKAAW